MPVLAPADWRARAAAHRDRVDALVGPYLAQRAIGTKHPVIDFLFTYYGHKPAQLKRWHPGFGTALSDSPEYAESRGYHQLPDTPAHTADPAFLEKRRDTIEFVTRLLTATATRPAQLSCFGLHEWAMVYRTDDLRHQLPLRLGSAGTDAVVDSMQLRCTHYDAFRFFTPQAIPLNIEPLTRDTQEHREQPGCLHANMDLYKWGFKLTPLISSDLLFACFELACAARELDMKASPYDLSTYSYTPIRIETPSGRAEYVRAQAEIATRAEVLRTHLTEACRTLLSSGNQVDIHTPHL
ncbi:3-methyladenine DNA glycosylase [Nocardia sp. SYP-A9097]|uniref:3-methyladenine DNA glycosylase n=1 Tax=Nocardia sp. SYP-A9097 TaxID=2663237 RepID=UPI0013250C97|nr:3-methyladenine DNA glycosylase [Nocardia sp. SYP-A9097]